MGGAGFYLDIKGWLLDSIAINPVPLIFVFFWIVLLLTSLRGVDRRDEIAHVTYAGVFLALAIVMLVGSISSASKPNSASSIVFCAMALLIPGFRWGAQRSKSAVEFMEQKTKTTK